MAENNLPAVTENKKQIITFADLNLDPQQAFKNDQFKALLNQEPKAEWLKDHPIATKKVKDARGTTREVPAQYIPIDKVEFMLDRIFQEWRNEIISAVPAFNSIMVVVRVHYKNPMTQEWSFHDGIGAAPMQTDKGSTATDFSNLKSSAVQIGAPAAASYALKDAVEHLGKLFGRDINRADTIPFVGAYSNGTKPQQPTSSTKETERLVLLIKNAKTLEELEKFKNQLDTVEARTAYDDQYKKLK